MKDKIKPVYYTGLFEFSVFFYLGYQHFPTVFSPYASIIHDLISKEQTIS